MSASLRPMTLEEFLDWERRQPERYEFDGVEPVAMTGGTVRHARVVGNLFFALRTRLGAGCEAFAGELKVVTAPGRARYPDVLVACGVSDATRDTVEPTLVFEVPSPSTEVLDRTVKAREYTDVASINAYVLLEQQRRELVVLRRAEGWVPRTLTSADDVLDLPEVGIAVPLAELYRGVS